MSELVVRPARLPDVEPILRLINELAASQIMLPRSPASVIENVRDFVVTEQDGTFAGCGALHVTWSDIAEIRSVAVAPAARQRGIGKAIVERLIADADKLGVARLFAFTYVPAFFEKLGFAVVEHGSLPHKVFTDCLNCPKFNCCDEIAMLRVLRDEPPPGAGLTSVPEMLPLPRRQVRESPEVPPR